MKNREDIEAALTEEYQHLDDPNHPMDEMQWANNQGWIEALEFVLDITHKQPKDISHLIEGANNGTITRALKRLSKIYGFGRKDNAIDSKNDSVCHGWLYATEECTSGDD